ncbi:hypothetical protein ALP36_04374 [Pseudomonas syringae pv. coriandricola]|uniref:NYN domain-containing protein n=1 Tax=Pseudomonas syringae pv. coriandricola TaxID=264453 RepID=A0A3M4UDT0_9PSED|nr:NYN domain-containing protein [Pseudomonas syringae group genomosp. 3]RMR37478.1 hypothetical protein ALP87_04384 [Pseudomonas syringae pv. coriandricola]RMU06859.1 hypothetical protein ALP36_04374 [Pseudomonas syringae pv. coriandricola]
MATHTALNAQKHLAVLIDADNAPAAIVEGLFEEIAKYGVASVKRIYGDWTGPQLGGWKKVLLDHSIQPIQQFAYTKGKNATDSSLIIDAMDLLYTRRFDGFCLVSSDSDFTRLASRLDVGRVMCFPGGFSLEQAQELQAKLQDVVTASIKSLSTDQLREVVVTYMLTLISEVSAISETVSSTCDIALVDGNEVMVAMSAWTGDLALTFAPMAPQVAG